VTPARFLQFGGLAFLALGIVGFLMPNIGGAYLWFDIPENYAHLITGIVAVVLAPMPIGTTKKWLVLLIGLLAVFFGIIGFLVAGNEPPNFYGITNLENPLENAIHLTLGIWALMAAMEPETPVTA
jgi:hypothetical protein